MSAFTVSRKIELVSESCINCDVTFAMPDYLQKDCKESGRSFYCPNGHSMAYRASENARLREQVETLNAQLVYARDQEKAAKAEADRIRKEQTKTRHRVGNGVCPCCNRSFVNLQRHMKGQHPAYVDGAA